MFAKFYWHSFIILMPSLLVNIFYKVFFAKLQIGFTGKTIVATGKLAGYTRNVINDRIISLGAKAGSSVTRNTDYLIVGDKPGSKLTKAKELGIPILSEQDFESMIA